MRFVVARVENDLVPAVRHVMRGFQADMAAVGIDVSAHGPDFESALAALPGKYVPAENGALFLAVADPAGDAPHGAVVHERDLPEPPPLAAAAGCIALKQLKGEPGVGEVKRMFVPPEFRGHGVARILLGTLLDEARARGYSRLVLSTRDSLVPAIRLYEAHGFRPTPVYDGNPLPDIVCFALDLAPDPEPQLVPLEPRHWDRAVAMMQAAWPAGYKRFGLSTALVRREACEAFLRRAQQDAAHVRAVVAEAGGEVVGINMLWLYDPPVASVGPLGVAPAWQGRGLGRRLLDWAVAEAGPDVSTRLVVATGVVPTYALYCAGGFDAYLQVALLTGVARPAPEDAELVRGVRVRQLAGEADVAACSALHAELLAGEGRAGEIRASLAWADARPRVAEDAASGALLGYTNGFMGDGHAVARSRAALAALLFDHCADGAEAKLRVVQDKRPGLLRWAMARGMRVAMPRTVMATAPPDLSGCWEAGGEYSPSQFW